MRVVKGIGALVALLAMVVGVPVALLFLGGNPLPDQWSLAGLWQVLSQPASDRVLIGFLAIIGWIAWAGFTVSVLVEVVNIASGYRIKIRIPVLNLGQKLTAALIIAVVTMLGASQLAGTLSDHQESTGPAAPAVAVTTPGGVSGPAQGTPLEDGLVAPADHTTDGGGGVADRVKDADRTQRKKGSKQTVHIVKPGEFLWNLAEEYLGDGLRWHEILEANGLDSTTLQPGQRLVIPTDKKAGVGADHADHARTVTVRKGDSLSSISERLWGSPHRWQELWEANRGQVADPDQIEVGQVLTIPGTTTDEATKKDTAAKNDTRGERSDKDSSDKDTADKDTDGRGQQKESDRRDDSNGDDHTDRRPEADRHGQDDTTAPHEEQRTEPAPPTQPRTEPAPSSSTGETGEDDEGAIQIAAAAASVGLILAAGLVGSLALRRRRQLASRQPGQTPALPGAKALELESRAARMDDPLTIAQLDQALRSIAAHAAALETPELPDLVAARVATSEIHLLHRAPTTTPPPPGVSLEADGSVWVIHHQDLPLLLTAGSLDTVCHPWPALVTLGRTSDDAHILLNLEAVGALSIVADTDDQARRAVATLASELAVSPWTSDLTLMLAGLGEDLTAAIAHPRVHHVPDLDTALSQLEARAEEQQPWLDAETVAVKRLDADLADAWTPVLLMVTDPLTDEQADRLTRLVTSNPRVAIAATTSGNPITDWAYQLGGDPIAGRLTVALHDPLEWELTPTMLSDEDLTHMVELLDSTGEDRFDPAHWWTPDASPEPAHADKAGVTAPGEPIRTAEPVQPRRRRPLAPLLPDGTLDQRLHQNTEPAGTTDETVDAVDNDHLDTVDDVADDEQLVAGVHDGEAGLFTGPGAAAQDGAELAEAPMLQIFGPPEIRDAAGTATQNPGRCMELLLALLERPGRSTRQLAEQFALSPATIRSVISYLRAWLGTDPDASDVKWLPDASPGRGGYRVDDRVTSDWHHAQMLLGTAGVNGASTETLRHILGMVRGRPLEGTSDWVTTEYLRSQITAFLEDVSHQLTNLALEQDDLELARWSNNRGLQAEPESERLLTDKIRIADRVGDQDEVRRLVGKVSHNARALALDLSDDTRDVLANLSRR